VNAPEPLPAGAGKHAGKLNLPFPAEKGTFTAEKNVPADKQGYLKAKKIHLPVKIIMNHHYIPFDNRHGNNINLY
jgi:hypothetical protein